MKKIKDKDLKIKNHHWVKLTSMGNISEIMYMKNKNNCCPIKIIDKNHYIKVGDETGELYECIHIENRSEGTESLYRTFRTLRNIINTNTEKPENCRWITLTYAENMTDDKKIRVHQMNFTNRLRQELGQFEYISVREPQGRGAWHLHIIIIFPQKAPYISTELLQKTWKQGIIVSAKKLDDVDNIGAYLTAYLADLDIEQCGDLNMDIAGCQVKQIDLENEKGEVYSKYYVKGARLSLYPPKMNLYTYSRGIKKPIAEYDTYKNAQKKISSDKLTFSTAVILSDEDKNYENIIIKEYYNKNRK